MNKAQLIETWRAGMLNEKGKDQLIDYLINGEPEDFLAKRKHAMTFGVEPRKNVKKD